MRQAVDEPTLRRFIEALGKRAKGPGRVYLVGGATALLLGMRSQTIDIDLKLAPEPLGVFEAIAELKNQLEVNVELASPDDFVPALPGWQDRSEPISHSGLVEFFHYDFYGQALAKITRGHSQDLEDVRDLVRLGRVEPAELRRLFEQVKSELIRYPALDAFEVERRLNRFLVDMEHV